MPAVLCETALLAGWPTARITDGGAESQESKRERGSGGIDLQTTALLAGWTTPSATDGERGGEMTDNMSGSSLTQQAPLSGWATPRCEDSESTGAHRGTADTLHSQTQMMGWPTPTALSFAESHQPGNNRSMNATMELLGSRPLSSRAATANTAAYQLNPAMSRWLQGYPKRWDQEAPSNAEWLWMQRKLTASAGCEDTETALFRS